VIHLVALAALCWSSREAAGAYTGLSVEHYTTVSIGGSDRDVYRVYANFTTATERVIVGGFGSPSVGPMLIESRNRTDSGAGSAFFNAAGANNTAPYQELIDSNPDAEWDSFCTVGVAIADQAEYGDFTMLTPGFPPIAGTSVSSSNAGWSVFPVIDHDNDPSTPTINAPQTISGYAGDGDPLLRIMVLQLTVNTGDNIRGTMNLMLATGLEPGTLYVVEGQTFNSVPGPGAAAVVAVFAWRGPRRRRQA
jgi:hypothetical protein